MDRLGCLNSFPYGWVDPLDLYGDHLPELKAAGCNLDTERKTMKELVEKYGASWVWNNQRRLALITKALKNYPRK